MSRISVLWQPYPLTIKAASSDYCFLAIQCLEIRCSWTFAKSSGGHLYILAATKYFSKWAKAVALNEVKIENVVDFIRVNRYGVPHYIVTNNGIPFHNKAMENLCTQFNSKYHNSLMYHVPTNGLIEALTRLCAICLRRLLIALQKTDMKRLEKL